MGFVVVDRRSPQAAEIQGIALVEVKTLDGSADYAPYEATNAFYERNGFAQIDCIDEFPEWEPGNPAAIDVAALATTK